MYTNPIQKNNIKITFGEGIDTLRSLNLWEDKKIFISELVLRVLMKRFNKNGIILFRIKVLDNEKTWNIVDLDLTIKNYLMLYQTIDERQLSIDYGFIL
jgi:hypothetical protein